MSKVVRNVLGYGDENGMAVFVLRICCRQCGKLGLAFWRVFRKMDDRFSVVVFAGLSGQRLEVFERHDRAAFRLRLKGRREYCVREQWRFIILCWSCEEDAGRSWGALDDDAL